MRQNKKGATKMIVEIFYYIDEFCKFLDKNSLLSSKNKPKRKPKLSLSEVMTICVLYHGSGYKTFKDYYIKHVLINMKKDFKNLVSYNRFTELRQSAAIPLLMFTTLCKKSCTGISFIDSTKLEVCNVKRQYSNKTFSKCATKGKTSMAWFYGFKLHIVINERGEIIDFAITKGNVADNNKKLLCNFAKRLFGKLVGDKGYIGSFEYMFKQGIQMIHKIRSNMKNKLVGMFDKLLLRKRGVVESVFGILKDQLSLEHTRHRSRLGFLAHISSTIIAYFFRDKKPHLRFNRTNVVTNF
jgi:hypothetical protein